MKKFFIISLLILSCLFSSGCFKAYYTLQIKSDLSGIASVKTEMEIGEFIEQMAMMQAKAMGGGEKVDPQML